MAHKQGKISRDSLISKLSPANESIQSSYDQGFYDRLASIVESSAAIVVPLIDELLMPTAVCDVGGGLGAWLVPFAEKGHRILCLDGPWVDRSRLLIPQDVFREVDLRSYQPDQDRFDLALCLEVGEHIPRGASAGLVRSLTRLAPAVLFSAALPGQGGDGHINERPTHYWRRLFEEEGFIYLDPIRRHVWQNPAVAWWYQQNLRLYVQRQLLETNERLRAELRLASFPAPELYESSVLSMDGRIGSVIAKYRKVRNILTSLLGPGLTIGRPHG